MTEPWKSPLPRPVAGPVSVPPQESKYRVFHWTHETFQVGPKKHIKKLLAVDIPRSPRPATGPIMSLPAWKGPWPKGPWGEMGGRSRPLVLIRGVLRGDNKIRIKCPKFPDTKLARKGAFQKTPPL